MQVRINATGEVRTVSTDEAKRLLNSGEAAPVVRGAVDDAERRIMRPQEIR